MSDLMVQVVISATAEVRDADGNLISSSPIEATTIMTAEQAAALTQGDSQWQ
jgi:hypothetical protein